MGDEELSFWHFPLLQHSLGAVHPALLMAMHCSRRRCQATVELALHAGENQSGSMLLSSNCSCYTSLHWQSRRAALWHKCPTHR